MRNKTFIIAEIGQAHEGSLGILHSYIDAIATTGVDAIKFQIHIAAAESSEFEPFRVKFSYADKTRFDYWKRMEFSFDQWQGIKEHCDKVGLEFMASPFSNAAVDILEKLAVKRYKIGSGEVTNFLILEKIAKTGKPIILSSGMSSFEELNNAIRFIQAFGNDISILQCTTSYPTPPEKLGLNLISELKQIYPDFKVGLSEHTGKTYACLAATTLGAEILEFHATFDRRMFGPDTTSSLTIDEIMDLVKNIRELEIALNHPINKNDNSAYTDLKKIFEKSLAVNKDLAKGHILSFDDLESKKPAGYGIAATHFKEMIGKKLLSDKKMYAFLKTEDVE